MVTNTLSNESQVKAPNVLSFFRITADKFLDLGQQSLTLTEPLFWWDGRPVLTADIPSSSAGTYDKWLKLK